MKHLTLQTVVFSFTLFLSAWLLFWVEPLVAKMLLPLLGGTPSVWNTSMMFYQGLLLLGYLYAHLITRYLTLRNQVIFHVLLLIAALFTLPIVMPAYFTTPSIYYPITWLLTALMLMIGAPLFVLCATAPLLQYWFSTTTHKRAHDPYFLYAASNLGSMLALLAYPFVLERMLTLQEQSITWSMTYGILILSMITCATFLKSSNVSPIPTTKPSTLNDQPSWQQQLRWIVLAFVPSSLLLAVTTYLTTDVASIPLLWVIPLAIYLLTFIITFSHQQFFHHHFMLKLQPVTLAMMILILTTKISFLSFSAIFLFQLLNFFVFAMVCHGELANHRPSTPYLTKFYLWIAVGGLLGGLLNALVAPLIFNDLWEYPLVLALACFLRPPIKETGNKLFTILFVIIILSFSINIGTALWRIPEVFNRIEIYIYMAANLLVMLYAQQSSFRYGVLVSLLLLIGYVFLQPVTQHALFQTRTFFGTYKITTDQTASVHKLMHGTTLHGMQYTQREKQKEPLAYYGSPLQEVFSVLPTQPLHIAAIGLGVGTVACYRRPQDTLTFFEIDPAVVKIAKNTRYFTFLHLCPPTNIILGDARLTIQHEPDHVYDIIIVDAFSSDSIPIHLLTKEALNIYLKKLKKNGLLALHISNRHLKLAPILARIANNVQLKSVVGFFKVDSNIHPHIHSSQWVVLSRQMKPLQTLLIYPEWKILIAHPNTPLWRDDFSNILSAM
ncbi:MAG: hypothetical protein A3F42_03885 [Gammaproteobacteria bacterium RIFCSPHIGHO2_12_FULL_37_34]|nr:MAG: hypothetical protein A3F42_03885 [Gammaproteobacteria bacterium RIFCSPHIGHO2_12_FULL_37_34]